MNSSIPILKRSLLLKLSALLFALAALLLYSHRTVIGVIRAGRQESAIVNATGRQRMLAQQFVRQANLALVGLSVSDWETLLEQRKLSAGTSAQFEQTMRALLQGGETRLGTFTVALPRVDVPEVRASLEEIAALWAEVKRASVKVLRSDTSQLRDHPDLALMQSATMRLVAKVDDTLLLMQQRESQRSEQLIHYQTGILLGGLGMFVLLAMFVHRSIINPLAETIGKLDLDIAARECAEAELENVHKQLLETSRQAGMAEVATSVLHNVGNVLNSVNTSLGVASDKTGKLRIASLGRVAALLGEHVDDLPKFFASHPQGRQLPAFLSQLAEHFAAEQQTLLAELGSLQSNFDHISEIVAMQQSYAGAGGVIETLSLADVIDDALRMNAADLTRHGARVVRELDATLPPVETDRHKVLLILTNLIRNAKHACDDAGHADKRITVRAHLNGAGMARISVSDNGVGIPAENLTRIFAHGFTTRKSGHGFGLHSSALAAREMGGSLRAHSDGPGLGAIFTLDLPL